MDASLARRRRPETAEAIVGVHASAACYRGPEDVRVLPVVMTELKFREIEWQVLGGDVVVRPDNPALEQRPEGIEVLRVDFAANVLARSMAHGLMREPSDRELRVARVLVGRDEFNLVGDYFAHETLQCAAVGRFDDSADDIPLPGNRADDGRLVRDPAVSGPVLPGSALSAAMAVLGFPTDIRLVDLHDAHQHLEVGIFHRSPEPVTHVPCGLIGPRPDLSLNLLRADALLAVEHLPENLEPHHERVLRVLEDRAADDGEAVGVPLPTLLPGALPVPGASVERVDMLARPAAGARHGLGPATAEEELFAVLVAREALHQRPESHHDAET